MRTLNALMLVGLLVLSIAPLAPVVAWAPARSDAPRVAPPHEAGADVDGFVENLGQFTDGAVCYYASWPGGGIALLRDGIAMTVRSPTDALDGLRQDPTASALRGGGAPGGRSAPEVEGCTVLLAFEGARHVMPRGLSALPIVRNYYIGNDPTAWRTGVRTYSEVVYEGLYEGIDLVYRSTPEGVKYDVLVAGGADLSALRVRAQGQTGLSIRDGALVMATPFGELVDAAPVACYRDGDGEAVGCAFALLDDGSYGLALEGRDPSRAVVIDPIVYATYLGDSDEDGILDMCLDASGKIYVAGATLSGVFPTTAGVYQRRLMGSVDGFVSRFSSDGRTLEMSTYLGGGSDFAVVRSMALDASGGIYLGGATSSIDFPVTTDAPQQTYGGGYENGFLCKMDNAGTDLLYSTYFGGEEYDYVISVAVDGKACLYATGGTGSYTMPVTTGAFQEQFQEGAGDAFAVKLSAAGDAFAYSTYLGGTDDEEGHGIAVDDGGFAYITGYTGSYDFPTTASAYSTAMSGSVSAYVTKLSKDGSSLAYSTYLGGSSYQSGEGITLDIDERAWVMGYTDSRDFPTSPRAYQTSLDGDLEDLFVTHLSADGSSLLASTLLGGRDSDYGGRLSLDPDGKPVVCGQTYSVDFPTTSGAAQTLFQGEYDGAVSKLSADLEELEYSTYLGGSGGDSVSSVATSGRYHVWAAGMAASTDLPVTADAYQSGNEGAADGFLVRLIMDSVAPTAVAGDDVTIDQHQTVELNGSRSSDNLGVVNFTWAFPYNGSNIMLFGPYANFTFHEAGRYTVTLAVRDVGAHTATDELNVTVRDITPPFASAGSDLTIDQHTWVTFDSSRSRDNVGIVGYRWTFLYNGTQQVLPVQSPSFLFDEAGMYDVTLNVTDAAGLWTTDATRIHIIDITGPVAEAGPNIDLRQHELGAFDGTGSSDNVGIVNWTWAFIYVGLPISLYGPSPTFLFDDAGRYTVTLTVRDERGLSATDSTTVIVADVDPPVARAGDDVVVDQGDTVVLDGRPSTDNVGIAEATWTLTIGDTLRTLTGLLSDVTLADAGVYDITLTVKDAMGNEATDTLTVTVRDIEPPVAMTGGDVHVDQHQSAQFDARGSVDNVGVVSWTWTITYPGGQVILNGPTASHVFDDAGTYTVNLTVADAAGNLATDALTVTVKDITVPVADAGLDLTVNQMHEVTLNGSASIDNVGVDEWKWTFFDQGAPIKLAGRLQRYTFELPGYYNITLTVTDAEGNTNATVLLVRVRDIVAPTASPPGHITIKSGDRARLDGSGSTDNVGITRWVWTFRDGGRDMTLEGMTASYAFKDAGDHTVTLTVHDAEGNTASETFTVTVEASMLPLLLAVVIAAVVVVVVLAVVAMRRRKRKGDAEGNGG